MVETKEINALFTLIDDPDEEVYSTVSSKIIDFGKGIIPNLENLWENTLNETIQERIEMLIHSLHYTDLINDFKEWKSSAYNDLLFGALLVSKFLVRWSIKPNSPNDAISVLFSILFCCTQSC